jgi:hypothetical protein
MNEKSFSRKWADWFWQIRLELKLTYTQFCILYTLFTLDNECTREHLIKYSKIFFENNLSDINSRCEIYSEHTISLEELNSGICELEKKKLIFCCSDTDICMLKKFFSWNDIQFVSPSFPRLGNYCPTYAGSIVGDRIIKTYNKYNSCILHNYSFDSSPNFALYFSNKNGKSENYILSDNEEGIAIGKQEQNKFDNYFQFSATFPIGTWCEHIWNVHPHGFACKII